MILEKNVLERKMSEDKRCCGSGACIIDASGSCWCGQKWDGEKMCFPDWDHYSGLPGVDSYRGENNVNSK